jgi:hypothetical protein
VGAAVVSAFDVVALIIGIFFVAGIAVGFLTVMAIPALGQAWANRRRPVAEASPRLLVGATAALDPLQRNDASCPARP